jgi:hypothetical protein
MLTLAAVWGVGDIPRLPLRTVAADRRVARVYVGGKTAETVLG